MKTTLLPPTESLRQAPKNLKTKEEFYFGKGTAYTLPEVSAEKFEAVSLEGNMRFTAGVSLHEKLTRLYFSHGEKYLLSRLPWLYKPLFFAKYHLLYKRKKVKEAILAVDSWSGAYFHWFADALPRLWVAAKHFPEAEVLLPIAYRNRSYIAQSLEALGLKPLFMEKHMRYEVQTLNYISKVAPSGNYRDEVMQQLREVYLEKYAKTKGTPTRRVYVSRAKAPRRFVVNEAEVQEVLKNYDFESVFLEELAWEAQVKLLAESSHFVGLHGAGLTNMLFMHPKTSVLELRGEDDSHNNCYFALASALGVDYYYQRCPIAGENTNTQDNNFYVDVEELEKNLKLMLRE